MPQTSVLPQWKADYPILQPRQKPSGIAGIETRTASASAWAAGVVTLTVPAVVQTVGTALNLTVAGFTPAGYNGSFQGKVASATSITYSLATNPGVSTVQGTVSFPAIIPLTISTTLPSNATPNKAMWSPSTIQTTQKISPPAAGSPVMAEEGNPSRFAEAEEAEAAEATEEEHHETHKGKKKR